MIPVFILTRTIAISALLVGAYAAPVPAPVPVPAPSLLDTVLTYASRVNLKQTAGAVYPALLVQGPQISDKRDVSAVLASTPVEDVEALVNEALAQASDIVYVADDADLSKRSCRPTSCLREVESANSDDVDLQALAKNLARSAAAEPGPSPAEGIV